MTHLLTTWAGSIPAYVTMLEAAGRAPGTITVHRHYLSRLRSTYPRRSPWSLTRGELLAVLATRGWAPETRKSARSVIRGFYRWGHGEALIEHDPARDLLTVRVPAAVARPTPEHLVRRLLEHPDPRIGLMVMLAALGGLRRSEIAAVHADDVSAGELIVRGKGGKIRAVPIADPRLRERLEALTGWAFPSPYGGHLSSGHVGRLIGDELPGRWTAHTLRHRMATKAYAGTRDLLAVGAVLGHSRPETTQRYVRLPDDALRAAVSAAGVELGLPVELDALGVGVA